MVMYCKSRNFRWCKIFGILQNRQFGGGKFSVNPFSRLLYQCSFIFGKNFGTKVTENETLPKISAFTVMVWGMI